MQEIIQKKNQGTAFTKIKSWNDRVVEAKSKEVKANRELANLKSRHEHSENENAKFREEIRDLEEKLCMAQVSHHALCMKLML